MLAARHVLTSGIHEHVADREPLADLVQRRSRAIDVGGRGLAQEVDVEVRRDRQRLPADHREQRDPQPGVGERHQRRYSSLSE